MQSLFCKFKKSWAYPIFFDQVRYLANPFLVFFKKERNDETFAGFYVWEYSDGFCPSFYLPVQPFDTIGCADFSPAAFIEFKVGHVHRTSQGHLRFVLAVVRKYAVHGPGDSILLIHPAGFAASETCVELTESLHVFSRMFFTFRVAPLHVHFRHGCLERPFATDPLLQRAGVKVAIPDLRNVHIYAIFVFGVFHFFIRPSKQTV